MQRAAIVRAAEARGDQIDHWFEEVRSVSKANTSPRPALDELRALACMGRLSRLYVFRLDRFTRTGIVDTLKIVEEFQRARVEIVTIADGFALDGPAAEVMIALLAWVARVERMALGERISAARARVEAEGKRWGRPLRVDDETQRKILGMVGQRSLREIAVALKVPYSTVRNVVSKKGAYGMRATTSGKTAPA